MIGSDGRRLRIGMFGLWGMNVPGRHFGGFETAFTEVAPRLVEAGHEVTIYCRRQSYPPAARLAEYRGVRLVYVPSWGGKNLSAVVATFFALLHATVTEAFDIYFFVNVGMGFHCALARLLGKRVVLNVDGLDWTRAKWGSVARAYFRSAAWVAVRVCHRLVTDAEAMRQFYLQRYARDTTMIAYGAYIESSERPELIELLGLQRDQYFLVLSRLVPENSVELIVEAYRASGARRKLVIGGGASYDSRFHRRLRAMASENVLFLGHVDDQALVRELYCNCYAYLHGHSVGGTNPALLRALGYGCCVVALDTVFNREVVGDAGLFFPSSHDSLAALLRQLEGHRERVVELRRRGPERIRQRYTWERISGDYERLFGEVAGRGADERHRAVVARGEELSHG